MPELEVALDTLRTSEITEITAPTPDTTALVFGPLNEPYYMKTSRFGTQIIIADDSVAAATTVDLSAIVNDGNIVQITGTDTIETVTLNEGESRILEFVSAGSVLTDTGGNLVIETGTITVIAGQQFQAVWRTGDMTQIMPVTHHHYLGDYTTGAPLVFVNTASSIIEAKADLISVGSALGEVILGDAMGGLGNSTRIDIDDANAAKTIEMNADNGIFSPNFISGATTTATAAGTTTLTVSSTRLQVFTGSTTQTVVLPVVTTLPQLGHPYEVYNDSSGVVTVNSSGSNAVQVMAAGSRATFKCVLLTGTTAASWAVQYVTAGGGAGTVTNSTTLTSNSVVLGNGTVDTKVVAGITTNGTAQLSLGVNATTLGSVKMFGNTSGDVTLQPAAVAGTATAITLPAASTTLIGTDTVNALTYKTLDSSTNTIRANSITVDADDTLPATCAKGDEIILDGGRRFSGKATNTWDEYQMASTLAAVNAQTGTTYTLLATDNGKIVTLSNAASIAVTVPSGLGAGFSCVCIQIGAGVATFTGSGATVNNADSFDTTEQYAPVSVVAYAANVFAIAGVRA
jgi:hypothetical protein